MIKTAAVAVVAALGLLVPAASASTQPHQSPACTNPTVVNDGLIEVRCFPVIPAKQFPPAGQKCNHIDAWTTGHSIETVNGQQYKITQRVRDNVWICKS